MEIDSKEYQHSIEIEYYKKQVEEQAAVIEQLHRGYPLPGKSVYIHPYDLAQLLNDLPFQYMSHWTPSVAYDDTYVIRGVSYKQSPHMPQITRNIK